MTQQRWDIPDVSDDDQSPERATPTLVSLHFIRAALRRRWLVCVLSPLIGLLLAIAFLVAMPPSHKATASLVLAHDPQVDPSRAMATDVSLLQTRNVAARVEENLGLTMPPEDFLKSVTAVPVSSELLTLTLSGPTDAEAVRRLNALTSIYLAFRGEQLSLQSNVLIGSMQQRIAKLKAEVDTASRQIDELSAAGSSSADKLGDQIAQRAYVQGRIDTLQQSIEDMTLQTTSVVASSRVIDPAAAETGGVKKGIVLVLASGIIGGAAFGWGTVLFFAIISDRLRRRSDISEALELPVPVSVGRIAPIPARWRRIPHLRTLNSHRANDRRRVAHAIEMELPVPLHQGRVAIACIDNADEVRFAIAEAAADLATSGLSVAIVDLTQQGSLDSELAEFIAGSSTRPAVLRPNGIPELATVSDLRAVGPKHEDVTSPSLEQADVVLVLADLDSSVGADYLTTWTDRVIFAVTSGRSSAERLRTAADLARDAGLNLRFAALLRTERTDDSLGGTLRAETVDAGTADLDQDFEESQPSVASSEIAQLDAASDELPDADEHLVAALTGDDQVMAEEPHTDIDAVFDEMQLEELQLEEPEVEDGQAVGEQPTEPEPVADDELVDEEELGVSDEHAEDEVAASVEELAASDEYSEEQSTIAIEAVVEDEQAEDEQTEAEVASDEHAEDEVAASVDELAASDEYSEEQPTGAIEAIAGDEQAENEQAEEQLTASEEQIDNEQAEEDEATLEQLPEDQQAEDAESIASEVIASEVIASEVIASELIASELIGSELIAEEQPAEEEPAIQEHAAAEEHPAPNDERVAAAEELAKDDGGEEAELAAEADRVITPGSEYGIVEGWYLDTAEDPAVPVGAIASPEGNFDWSWEWSFNDTEAQQPVVIWRPDLEAAPQTSPESAPSSTDNEHDPDHHWSLEEPDTIEDVAVIQGVDGWLLYIDRYPEAYTGTAPSFEDEKLDGSWDEDFDSLDSRHDSVVVRADEEVDEPSEPHSTASANGENHQPAHEIHAEEQAQNGAHPPAGNGQGSNGRVRPRARSRNRHRRSRIK